MIRRLLLSCCLLFSSVAFATGEYLLHIGMLTSPTSSSPTYENFYFDSLSSASTYASKYPILSASYSGAASASVAYSDGTDFSKSLLMNQWYISNTVENVKYSLCTFSNILTPLATARIASDVLNSGFRPSVALLSQYSSSTAAKKNLQVDFDALVYSALVSSNVVWRSACLRALLDVSETMPAITNYFASLISYQSGISGSLASLSPSVDSLASTASLIRSDFADYARQVRVLDSLPFSSSPSSDDMSLGVQALYNLTPTASGANTPEEQYTQLKSMYQLPWTDLSDATSHGGQFMQIVKGKVAAERKRVDAIASVADSYNHVKNPVTGEEQTLVEALETWGNDLAQAALFNYQYETPTTNNPYKALVGGDELRKQLRADVEAMRRWIHQGLVEGALPVTNPSNGAPLSVTVTGGIAADLNVDQVEALLGNTYNVRLDGMDTIDSWFGYWRNYTGMINSGSPGYLKTYLDRFNEFTGYSDNHNYLLDAKNALYNNYDSISEITYNGLNTANTTLSYIANSVASDGPIVSGLTSIEDAIKNINLTNSVAAASNILVNVTNEYALSKVSPVSNLGPLHIDLTIDRDHAVAFKASQVTMTGDFYVDSIRLLQGQIEQSRSSAVTLGVLQTNLQAIANQFVDFDQADAESTVNREISEIEQSYSDHENDVNTLTQHIVSDFNASMDTYLQEARTILSKFEAIPSSVLKPQYIQVNLPSFGGKSLGSFSINLSSSGVSETIESVRTCFSFLWWCLAAILSWFLYRLFFRMVDAVIHRCLALGGLQVGYSWVRSHGST